MKKFLNFLFATFWGFIVCLILPVCLYMLNYNGPDYGLGGLVVIVYSLFAAAGVGLGNGILGLFLSFVGFKIFGRKINLFWILFSLPIIQALLLSFFWASVFKWNIK